MQAPSPGQFVFGLAVSVALSLIVFSHASRNGSRRATAWGIVAFVFAGIGAATYFLHFVWARRRRG